MATPPGSLATGQLPSTSQQKPKYTTVPSEWKLELPEMGAGPNDQFGGCRRIEDSYERLIHLGAGTYGDVFQARCKTTGDLVAVKRIKMDADNKEGFPITAIREIKILSKLAACDEEIGGSLLRNNIVRLREIVRSDSHESNKNRGSVYMVFDYMEHDMAGLLDRAIREKQDKFRQRRHLDPLSQPEPPFAIGQVKCYMRQLFLGLALLQTQKNNILHRDLKNANLLVSKKGELKIADFGLARSVLAKNSDDGVKSTQNVKNLLMTNKVITLWYRPPELLLGADSYGKEVDMWSAGCIMAELLSGKPLFPGRDETKQFDLICKVLGKPLQDTMPGCTNLPHYQSLLLNSPNYKSYSSKNRLREKLREMRIEDPLAVDLLEQLLSLDPSKRPGAADAALHKWFDADPKIFTLEQMPRYDSSHEMTMKKKRQAEQAGMHQEEGHDQRRQRVSQPHPQQQQQYQGYENYNAGGHRGYGGPSGGHGGQGYGRGAGGQSGRPPTWQQERR